MKVFIINLKRSFTRREHILREVRRNQLDFELMEAVDGSELSRTEVAHYCDCEAVRRYPDWLTPGAIGCALSHYNVLKTIIDRSVPYALVVEDDVAFPDNITELLVDIRDEMREHEVVMLHYFGTPAVQLSTANATVLGSGYQLLYPLEVQPIVSAAGYAITLAAARTLAAVIRPIRATADSWGFFHRSDGFRTIRCVYPVPLRTVGAKSDISARSQSWVRRTVTSLASNYNIPVLAPFLRGRRLAAVERRSQIRLVSQASPLAPGSESSSCVPRDTE